MSYSVAVNLTFVSELHILMLGQREKYAGVMVQSNYFSKTSRGDGYLIYHFGHEVRPALLVGFWKG